MLAIQKYIHEHGIEKTILDFKLKTRVYEHKMLLKYDQLVSPTLMALPEMQDCRGIILERGTWKVMSLSFRKFFNHGEGNAAKIDWNTAHVLEKVDGTMIQVYWDWHKNVWFAGTTGTAEGEGEVNNKLGTTFNDLFWATVNKYEDFAITSLNKDYVYVFELTTPYNIVVKPHGESSVTLLAVRNRVTLEEVSYDGLLGIGGATSLPVVKRFDLNQGNVGALLRTFEGMPWSEEGYIVVDGNFNRIKIKNPAYVAVHHLKGKTAEHNIIVIVKTNEIEEYSVACPERKEELLRLKVAYDALLVKLEQAWSEIVKPKNISPDERKKFAMSVYEVALRYDVKIFTGLFFGLQDGKYENVNSFMLEFDDKQLYRIL